MDNKGSNNNMLDGILKEIEQITEVSLSNEATVKRIYDRLFGDDALEDISASPGVKEEDGALYLIRNKLNYILHKAMVTQRVLDSISTKL